VAKKQQTFEQGLEQLETLVKKMESDSLPLEEAMAAYEQGVKLASQLNEQLDRSERALTILRPESEIAESKGSEA
jgi:exodeoxyribonuclease VII small subunit